VVAGRSRTRAGRPHAVSGRPMLIHTCHARVAPMTRYAVALRCRFQEDRVVAWHGRGRARQSAAGRGTGAARARHGRGTGAALHV
jgi:hypothetical protein